MAGKSTILQVLALLSGAVKEDFHVFLKERNWEPGELRSKCREKSGKNLKLKRGVVWS